MIRKKHYIFIHILKLVIFLLAGIVTIPVSAQKSKADKLFDNKQYHAAALIYEKEIETAKESARSEMLTKVGTCYLKINRPQKALHFLQQATSENKADGNFWYQYGLALQQTGEYRSAIQAFEQCLKLQANHPSAANKIASCRFALQNNQINPYTSYRLATEVNTAGGEFGVSLYTNNIIYYSVAGVTSDESKIDQRTGLQYIESNMARLHNKRLINQQAADGRILSDYVSAGLFAYDSIAQRVYFAYCDDHNRCGIYSSQLKNNKWSVPEMILQNKRNQTTGHPAIANGGTRLYFTSNAPEGVGQTDIWYIDRIRENKWGQPVNAGNVINTPGREEFPFVYADSLLFFASDGHIGYGGLDIFCSVIRDHSFSPPVNLRRPYNSQGDDFNLVMSGSTGFMSSSRNELVSDDIYMFTGLPSLLYVSGHVTDAETGNAIGNTRLTLSVNGKAVQHTVSDSTGYYGLFLKGTNPSMLYVRATGYKPSLSDMKISSDKQFTTVQRDIRLQLSNMLPVTVSLYDKITGKPITERGIICFNNDGETQIMRTDAAGTFKLAMQEDQREYWIKFPDGYYLTESIILNEEQKNYSLGVQPLNEELFPGWLRFKNESTEPTEMSQPLILRIAAIIKANPGIVFQITGYSDAASEARLPNLPNQRAEYIMRRMIEEGVDKRQLIVVADKNTKGNKPSSGEEANAAQRKVVIKVKR